MHCHPALAHSRWKVVLPFFNLTMGVIGAMGVFTSAYVMTGGGPNNATLFYALYLFRNAFEKPMQ